MNAILLQILLGLGSGALIAGLAVGSRASTYRGLGHHQPRDRRLRDARRLRLLGAQHRPARVHRLEGPALIIALVFVMAVAALAELVIFRPLRNSPPLAKLVASLGVLLTMQASMLLSFGTLPHARAAGADAEHGRDARRGRPDRTASSSPGS